MISLKCSRQSQNIVFPAQAGIQWRTTDNASFPPARERRNVSAHDNRITTGATRK